MSKIEWTDATWNPVASPDRVWEAPLRRRKPTTYFVNSMCDLFHPNVTDALIDRAFAVMALAPQHRFQVLTKHPERMRAWMRDKQRDEWGDLYFADFFWAASEWPYFASEARRAELDSLINDGNREDALCCKPFLWDNVWLGVSVEDQRRADERVPVLLATPAAVRFVSCEPLLGPVDLTALHCDGVVEVDALRGTHGLTRPHGGDNVSLDWVIVGGESGPSAKPMHPDWARSLRDQCAEAGVPFFFKQWGAWLPWEPDGAPEWAAQNGAIVDGNVGPWIGADGMDKTDHPKRTGWDHNDEGEALCLFQRVSKAKAGRRIDGALHDAMPERDHDR